MPAGRRCAGLSSTRGVQRTWSYTLNLTCTLKPKYVLNPKCTLNPKCALNPRFALNPEPEQVACEGACLASLGCAECALGAYKAAVQVAARYYHVQLTLARNPSQVHYCMLTLKITPAPPPAPAAQQARARPCTRV